MRLAHVKEWVDDEGKEKVFSRNKISVSDAYPLPETATSHVI